MLEEAHAWSPMQLSGAWSRPLEGGYRLWVHCPEPASEGTRLPILWLLDGATLFPAIAAVAGWLGRRPEGNGVGRMLVAAIDHDPPDPQRRYLDYSFGPPADPAELPGDVAWGGGARFAELLMGQARQTVAARFAFDPARQALLGHSLAGHFALRLLAEETQAFRVIGAISPSIWWNASDLTQKLTSTMSDSLAVFLAAGSEEGPVSARGPADARRRRREMVGNAEAAAAILASNLGPERVEFHVAPGETHGSAIISQFPAYLRFMTRVLGLKG